MSCESTTDPRILVAIASYGSANREYLLRVVNEYRAMPFDVDVIIVSNQPQDAIPDVEVVIVDLRGKDPYSLPFSHRRLLAERLNGYDLFIYAEDDHLITERNIRAFVDISRVLAEDEIAGLLRFEYAADGSMHYPDIHGHFHWDPGSVSVRGEYVFAQLTNAHSGCYILTQKQLKQAIESGGFLVEPHTGKYDLRESAATDPYTQCGFRKVICISQISSFLVHHLPNKYVRINLGIGEAELRRQVDLLLEIASTGHCPPSFFAAQAKMATAWYAKPYYDRLVNEVMLAIPRGARSVLSVGCGWGAVEGHLAEQGLRVVAVPLDAVIAGAAEAKGVEIIKGDFRAVRDSLAKERFDCVLFLNILHLVEDPVGLLRFVRDKLSPRAHVIVQTPNFLQPSVIWKIITRDPRFDGLGHYERSGAHFSSPLKVRSWLKRAGLVPEDTVRVVKPRFRRISRSLLGLADSILADEFVTVATCV
jgi:2-polyprenyl-3-methyl-5-hydroxy-6-metoxy-1,4-benzoquinol methylase